MTVYLTGYSDGLTRFLESLLPPYTFIDVTLVWKMSCMIAGWKGWNSKMCVCVCGGGGGGGGRNFGTKSNDLTVAGSSSKSENIFSVKKLMALLAAPGALFLLLVRFFAGGLTSLLLLIIIIMTVIQWNCSTVFTSRGIIALKYLFFKLKGTSPLGWNGGEKITAFTCAFL